MGCSDVRDRVYALLSIFHIKVEDSSHSMPGDAKSPVELFIWIAKSLRKEGRSYVPDFALDDLRLLQA
jgi:hypothetical protein